MAHSSLHDPIAMSNEQIPVLKFNTQLHAECSCLQQRAQTAMLLATSVQVDAQHTKL